MLQYNGFSGKIIGVDEDTGCFYGIVILEKDVVTFEGRTVVEVVQAFHNSVDDYLAFCQPREGEE